MEFGIFSTIQCLMSSQKQKGNFVKRMIERNKGNREIELQL